MEEVVLKSKDRFPKDTLCSEPKADSQGMHTATPA